MADPLQLAASLESAAKSAGLMASNAQDQKSRSYWEWRARELQKKVDALVKQAA